MEILGSIRRKYFSFVPKDKDVVDPESGEVISSLDKEGREILDATPIAPPVGWTNEPNMFDYVRELVRSAQLAKEAEEAGMETFEESEDFDVDDDFDPSTPYENDFDPDIKEMQEAVAEHKRTTSSKAKESKSAGDQPAPVTEPAQPAASAEPDNGSAT